MSKKKKGNEIFQKKYLLLSPPPLTDGKLEILAGGGLMALEIWAGGESETKNSSSGLTLNLNLD